MSKKANPAIVGAFTLGGLVVLVAILLVFGADRFLKRATDAVLYFDGSVEGLDVGAPVLFRGVKIGVVKDIQLVHDAKEDEFRIPVVIEIFEGAAMEVSGESLAAPRSVEELVDRGMRASLMWQSFLTGKLSVKLDLLPDTEPKMVIDHTGLPQIPTVRTPLEKLTKKLETLPLEELVRDVQRAAHGISVLVNTKESRDLVKNLEQAARSVSALADALERQPESMLKGRHQKERY